MRKIDINDDISIIESPAIREEKLIQPIKKNLTQSVRTMAEDTFEAFQEVLMKAIDFQKEVLSAKELMIPQGILQQKVALSMDITSKFMSLLLKVIPGDGNGKMDNFTVDDSMLSKINQSIKGIRKVETMVIEEKKTYGSKTEEDNSCREWDEATLLARR